MYLRIPDAGGRCWHADLRDKGVSPRYLVSLSSLLVAVAPFTATRIREPFLAVIYGMNVGGVWGVKGTMAGMVYADFCERNSNRCRSNP